MRVAAKTVDDRLVLLLKFGEMLHAESFKQLQGLGMVLGGLAVHQRHVEKGGSRTFQLGVVTGGYGRPGWRWRPGGPEQRRRPSCGTASD